MRAAILLAIITIASYASDAQVPYPEGQSFMMTMHVRGKEIRFAIGAGSGKGTSQLHSAIAPRHRERLSDDMPQRMLNREDFIESLRYR